MILRRWIPSLVLFSMLLFSLAACGEQTDPAPEQPASATTAQPAEEEKNPQATASEDPSLTALRETIAAEGNLCGIAFLGNLPEGDQANLSSLIDDSGYLEDYPFLDKFPQRQIVAYEGTEVYCLVPRDLDVALTVRAWISNEQNHYQGEAGKTLYESSQGLPVILIGNVNDVIPNLQVTLADGEGQTLSYSPCLNLCDGKVDLPGSPTLYDFSRYSSGYAVPASTSFLGTWQASGSQLAFFADGTMHFQPDASGEQMSGTFYVISNSTQYPAGAVLFEMRASDGSSDFWGIFTLTRSGSTLTVTNVSGDLLLNTQTMNFTLAG